MTGAEVVLAALTFTIMVVGLAGVVLPVLPDVWLIWLAALGYGVLAGFDGWVGGIAIVLITLLTVAGVVLDLTLGHAAARRGGASWQAIAASILLGLAGLWFFPALWLAGRGAAGVVPGGVLPARPPGGRGLYRGQGIRQGLRLVDGAAPGLVRRDDPDLAGVGDSSAAMPRLGLGLEIELPNAHPLQPLVGPCWTSDDSSSRARNRAGMALVSAISARARAALARTRDCGLCSSARSGSVRPPDRLR
jgi:uncharacterized protein YqgC (DUF456 family)